MRKPYTSVRIFLQRKCTKQDRRRPVSRLGKKAAVRFIVWFVYHVTDVAVKCDPGPCPVKIRASRFLNIEDSFASVEQ